MNVSTKENPELGTPTALEGVGRVASIDQARAARRRPVGLTDVERRLLLDEIAQISAELCELQILTADIARRATSPRSGRKERSA
jgi:hypothetical protein